MNQITKSYGTSVVCGGIPYTVGSGYGKHERLQIAADKAAELLAVYGLPIQVRGNSDGRSTGAFHDEETWTTWFGLGAWLLKSGRIQYSALFYANATDQKAIEAATGIELYVSPLNDTKRISVYKGGFRTLGAAFKWFQKFAPQYCPRLK